MKKNIISKALAGSVLVAASMSANAATTPVAITFGVLPAIVITPTVAFAPGDILTGTAASTCTWTTTFLDAVSAPDGAVGDVNVVRSGNGCPTQAISTGLATTTGVYKIDGGGTALNVDITVDLQAGAATNISFDPTGVATPSDISYPSVTLATGVPGIVNTGGTGYIVLYIGGTSTIISATDITAGETVSFDVVAVY